MRPAPLWGGGLPPEEREGLRLVTIQQKPPLLGGHPSPPLDPGSGHPERVYTFPVHFTFSPQIHVSVHSTRRIVLEFHVHSAACVSFCNVPFPS